MTRIRVLELIKSLDVGGAEKLLIERLAMTSRGEFDVKVGFLDPKRSAFVDALEGLGLPVICFGARGRTSLGWLIRLRRMLVQSPVDVVHVHSPLMAVGVRLVIRTMGELAPALVSTEHSVNYHRATQWLNMLTIHMDDRVIAVSTAVERGKVAGRSRRLTVVLHGANLSRIQSLRDDRETLSRTLNLPPGPRVVTVANYRAEKDLETLLAAAELVHRRVPSAQFLLAGSGPDADVLSSQIVDRGMTSYVRLLGQVEDAVRLTACADLFALTSVREGLPVAVMEALACGVPVVATDVGGLSEMIVDGENGFLTPTRSPEETSDRLVRLLLDPELLARMGTAALESSVRFDMRRAAREVEQIYQDLYVSRFRA